MSREISQKFGYNARDVLVEKNLWQVLEYFLVLIERVSKISRY